MRRSAYARRMCALLRAAFIFALAVALPMQSFAASFLLTARFNSAWAASSSTVVIDLDRVDDTGSRLEPVVSVAQPSLASHKSARTQREIRSAACCFAAMAANVRVIEIEPVNAVYSRTDLPFRRSLTADVLERPPRATLA